MYEPSISPMTVGPLGPANANEVHPIFWGSRFGGSLMGWVGSPNTISSPAVINVNRPSWWDIDLLQSVNGSVTKHNIMNVADTVGLAGTGGPFGWVTSMRLSIPVPPGATGVSAVSVDTNVNNSTFISSTSQLTFQYNPANGGSAKTGSRPNIGSNDPPGLFTTISLVGPFAPPTPGHFVTILMIQYLGTGEGIAPTGPLICSWARLSITWT
jgi:hypothetical protein